MKWEDVKTLSDNRLWDWVKQMVLDHGDWHPSYRKEQNLGKDTVTKFLKNRGIWRDGKGTCYILKRDGKVIDQSAPFPQKPREGVKPSQDARSATIEENVNIDEEIPKMSQKQGMSDLMHEIKAMNAGVWGILQFLNEKEVKKQDEINNITNKLQYNFNDSPNELKPLRTGEVAEGTSLKLYPSIKQRLESFYEESDYNRQQSINALLDIALKSRGY